MPNLYVTLIKLDPGAQTRTTSGPWARIEFDDGDIVGYDEDDNPAHVATIHTSCDDSKYLTAPGLHQTRYDRCQITVGEPE